MCGRHLGQGLPVGPRASSQNTRSGFRLGAGARPWRPLLQHTLRHQSEQLSKHRTPFTLLVRQSSSLTLHRTPFTLLQSDSLQVWQYTAHPSYGVLVFRSQSANRQTVSKWEEADWMTKSPVRL